MSVLLLLKRYGGKLMILVVNYLEDRDNLPCTDRWVHQVVLTHNNSLLDKVMRAMIQVGSKSLFYRVLQLYYALDKHMDMKNWRFLENEILT